MADSYSAVEGVTNPGKDAEGKMLVLELPVTPLSLQSIGELSDSDRNTEKSIEGVNFNQPPASTLASASNTNTSAIQATVESRLPSMGLDQPSASHTVLPELGPLQTTVENVFPLTNSVQPAVDTILSSTWGTIESSLTAVSFTQSPICTDLSTSPPDVNGTAANTGMTPSDTQAYSASSSIQIGILSSENGMQLAGNSSIPNVSSTWTSTNNLPQSPVSPIQTPMEVTILDVNQTTSETAISVQEEEPLLKKNSHSSHLLLSKNSQRLLRTKRSFTTEFKLECVEHAEKTKNKTKTAKLFNVNRRRVQEWCMQKEKLMAVPKQQKRLSGGGRRQGIVDSAPSAIQIDPLAQAILEQKAFSQSDLGKVVSGSSLQSSTINPSVFECISRSLSNIDFSTLPVSMVKLLQEWSELALQSKSPPETVAQNMALMSQALKKVESSPSSQFLVDVGEDRMVRADADGNAAESDMECLRSNPTATDEQEPVNDNSTSEGVEGNHDASFGNSVSILSCVGNPIEVGTEDKNDANFASRSFFIQHGTVSAESLLGENIEQESVGIEGPIMNTAVEQVLQHSDTEANKDGIAISSTLQDNSLDAVQSVILDALLQVASGQVTSFDQPTKTDTIPTSASLPSDEPKPEELSTQSNGMLPLPRVPERTRVKKCYTVEFKLECIAHAESTSKCAAARHFKVDRRRVQDWCSKKDKLQKLVGGHQILKMRERMDMDIEKQLAEWVKQQQDAGEQLTRKMVGDEATKLYQEKGDMNFVSSIGWVAKFMVRNGISLVSRPTLPVSHEEPLIDIVTSSA